MFIILTILNIPSHVNVGDSWRVMYRLSIRKRNKKPDWGRSPWWCLNESVDWGASGTGSFPVLWVCDVRGDGRFGSKMGQIGPKWDKSGAFSDQISVHLAPRAKCTEIWSEKSPDLSHLGPIWPILGPNLVTRVATPLDKHGYLVVTDVGLIVTQV